MALFKHKLKILLVLPVLLSSLSTGCSRESNGSFYRNLEGEEDGVIAVEIDNPEPVAEVGFNIVDQISPAEQKLVDELHKGETEKISFLLVNGESLDVIKSYQSKQSRILASVSKVPTALASLQNLKDLDIHRVAKMLKISHNGEASRYGRMAANAIDGTVLSSEPYTQAHSCPSEAYRESLVGASVLNWTQTQLPYVDWVNSSFHDSAGCSRENKMSAEQVVHLFNFAGRQGPVFYGKSFIQLLSIAGEDGTLRHRNRDHQGMIFAKTGTLTPVSNLAGFIEVKRGGQVHRYNFAILVSKEGSGEYTKRARKLIESLVRLWVNELLTGEPEPLYVLSKP